MTAGPAMTAGAAVTSPRPARRRPRTALIDVAWCLAALVGAASSAMDSFDTATVTGSHLFWALVVGSAGAIALWWRRRFPVGVAVLLLPLATITDVVGVAVLVAVYTVASLRSRTIAASIAAMHLLAGALYATQRAPSGLSVVEFVVLSVVLLLAALIGGGLVHSRRQMVEDLRARASRAEAEAGARAEQLRAAERERIAREMHDVLAHRLSLVSLYAGALQCRRDLSEDEVAQVAATIRSSAYQALEDLREILGVLRAGDIDGDLRPQPSLSDLDKLLAESRAAGIDVTFDQLPGPVPTLPASVSRAAYRIVQEGLTNAGKHAPGETLRVRIEGGPGDGLCVSMDNRIVPAGRASTIPGSRAGLIGLQERADMVGGALTHGIRRGDEGGLEFRVEARLPWPS